MKRFIILAILAASLSSMANPYEKSAKDPTVDEAQIPGTEVPVTEMNTAPTPAPDNTEMEEYHGTLKVNRDTDEIEHHRKGEKARQDAKQGKFDLENKEIKRKQKGE